jgi:hypothetical protein
MTEKIYVRAVERYTQWVATDPIEVDVEKLRKCTPPFEGETEQDLLEYLQENVWNNEDWLNTNEEIYHSNSKSYELVYMDTKWEVYSDTREKYGQEWLDVGVPNKEWRSMGGFEVMATSVEKS